MKQQSILKDKKFVILGGGPAGISAAETLRQSGFSGKIIILTKEDALPYDRTMLSKMLIKADKDKLQLRNSSFLE